ncbi:uncharacterized protein [Typha angustifolia]|uniref:uncharacterized protein n=1 Tax=Typha angustifolia TaxID=59011 RepID=UPI003C2EDD72
MTHLLFPYGMMDPRQPWAILYVFVLLSPFLLSVSQSTNTSTSTADSLNSTLRDYAFKALVRRRTGQLYQVPLPSHLSGVTASVMRLRGGSLWSRGVNSTSFRIPPSIKTVPYVTRLVIVFDDLGDSSSSYFRIPGYSLVAPVVGFLPYDASSLKEIEFAILKDPISVIFTNVSLPEGVNPTAKCASFGPGGSLNVGDTAKNNVCTAKSTGHFTIVVPSAVRPPLAARASKWDVWVVGCGVGAVGLILVCLVGFGIFRLRRDRKMVSMQSKAEEGEALEIMWIGRSKMPSAVMVRTQPLIEDGGAPS